MSHDSYLIKVLQLYCDTGPDFSHEYMLQNHAATIILRVAKLVSVITPFNSVMTLITALMDRMKTAAVSN